MFASALSHLKDFAKYSITFPQLIKLELFTLPMGVNSVLPITIVVSTIVTVFILMRSKELLAFVCIGGRIRRFLAPFVVAALFTSCFMLFFEYTIYPNVRRAQQKYMTERIKKQKYVDQRTLNNLWTMDNNKLVYIEFLDPLNNVVWNITEYMLNDNFQVDMVKTIQKAVPDEDNWTFINVQTADISVTQPSIKNVPKEFCDSSLLNDLMSLSAKGAKQLAPSEMFQAIVILKKRGLGTVNYEMLLGSKYANALSIIVLIIVVAPIGIDFSRRYSPIKSSVFSFFFGIAFWAVLAVFESLGNSAVVPPFIANFTPHLMFLTVGIVIMYWREKAH
jgi:lipopolysaccharide export system permease protein